MINLKPLIIDPTGWLEATWMDDDKQVQCTSYHPTQIDVLRADAATHGTPLDEFESQLAEWVASYVPPAPEPVIPEPVIDPVDKLKAFLAANPDVAAIL